jgi:hypothetical protein
VTSDRFFKRQSLDDAFVAAHQFVVPVHGRRRPLWHCLQRITVDFPAQPDGLL